MSKPFYLVIGLVIGVLCTDHFHRHYRLVDFKITRSPTLSFADGSVYSGPLNEEGLAHGSGRLDWPNGKYYEGDFYAGMQQGTGVLVEPDGTVYTGEFQNGEPNGRGTMVFENGTTYEGDIKHYMFDGVGTLTYNYGDEYVGDFKQNMITGHGHWKNADKSEYTGDVKDGLYDGKGELIDRMGNHYLGEFKEGMFHGHGAFTDTDGVIYTGDFVEGSFTGNGAITYPHGSTYVGGVDEWTPHGEGVMSDGEGNQQKGQFAYGELDGKGSYRVSNGTRYQGEFTDGQPSGRGTLVDVKGNTYMGDFRYGRKHGQGQFTYKEPVDGVTTFRGKWRNGRLVEAEDPIQIFKPEEISEALLYGQEQRLSEALAELRSNNSEVAEMYTLGIAGFGAEEVFNREINYLEKMMNAGFSKPEHSIYLSNTRRDISSRPMATLTSVERSLEALSNVMDKDRDILFLYITSHGNEDKTIAINQPGFDLPYLTSKKLAELLEKTGIKHKVVVLSACYSGGFIEDLEDKNTLIITAAAADKTSFGCDDENQFTYFGQAFFQEALPESSSFEEAFNRAAALIEQWETERELEPSNPQMRNPERITAYLNRWWQHRKRPPEPGQ